MAGLNPGKRFERAFKASLDSAGYALRINDKCYLSQGGRLLSEPSEGDFWFFSPEGRAFLVECKACGVRSFPFSNLRPEQEAALLRFDSVSERTHGVVALNFYGERIRGKNALYLVGIADYLAFKASAGRKSLPEAAAAEIGITCPRAKGGMWDVPLGKEDECVKITSSRRATPATAGSARASLKE